MIRKKLLAVTIMALVIKWSYAQNKISLAGQWGIVLDADSIYYSQSRPPVDFNKLIILPGTTDQAKLGTQTSGSDYGILTRGYKHIGPAWYRKEVNIPVSWKDKNIQLYLERVLWESKVFIDGREISTLSPLYTAHKHELGKLSPGKHTITICINNDLIHNIGDKGHGYTEYTQSIWNGIVGRIELQKSDDVAITAVKTYPDADRQQLRMHAFLKNASDKNLPATITATIREKQGNKVIKTLTQKILAKPGGQEMELLLDGLRNLKTWDEFSPALYEVSLTLKNATAISTWKDDIGFRKISTTSNKIMVNDKAAYIRGNLDCVHFPITGYPSCDEKDWEAIFKKHKDYGLNTVRFHSWCPPEAAFRAADKMGIYIQAEVLWIDWWMTKAPEDRPEMHTKGHPEGLGKNPSADAFTQAEIKRILDAYGNHPSFLFFCIGNELGNSDFDVMAKWIQKAKNEDPRRLYAVSTARKIMPVDDYMVTHNIPNVGGTYGYSLNKTDAGLEKNYSRATIPIIAHEVGQAPVYPEWKEIGKYTGVLKPRNLEGFKKTAEKNGVAGQDKDFHKATGALQQLLYKNLIENVLLAPSSAGFQMLSMSDYQGQGEALIGWLDCFWDDKGTTSPTVFREYSNTVVPLIRTQSFTYTHADTIRFTMELANYHHSGFKKVLCWKFTDDKNQVIREGNCKNETFPQGALTVADSVTLLANQFPDKAGRYTFWLYFADNSYSNSWEFFVFPTQSATPPGEVIIAQEWNEEIENALARGGKVLLLANKLGNKANTGAVSFTPLFWSASFFPGQGNETLGSMIDDKSAAFNYFPTGNYTNWQWYKVTPGARYFKLSNMPKDYKPIVQPVSDFHYNEKLGSIFETRVGAGKLLVCGYDLKQPGNPFAQQLYYSLVEYMKSNKFNPSAALPRVMLKTLLAKTPEAAETVLLPDAFKNASLYINAAAAAKKENVTWQSGDDGVAVNKGFNYSISGANIFIADQQRGWKGRKMVLDIAPPKGIKGYVYLHFTNTGGKKLNGTITLEGRDLKTGEIPAGGKWVKVFMMREDTNDGNLPLEIISDTKEPLEVDQLVVMEEE